jgi:hypothetical protein
MKASSSFRRSAACGARGGMPLLSEQVPTRATAAGAPSVRAWTSAYQLVGGQHAVAAGTSWLPVGEQRNRQRWSMSAALSLNKSRIKPRDS